MQHSLGQETYLKCTDDIISTVELGHLQAVAAAVEPPWLVISDFLVSCDINCDNYIKLNN